ncbi:MAG: lysophospholipid acyltransferase family protein [Melioribacteraceae bacterium]|nr:lysophospholipid acyltransferase family protein [Melioribacteraceae bacterium]
MQLKEIKKNILWFLGNRFLFYSASLLCKTVRIEKKNFSGIEELINNDKNFVLAFWHGSMFIPWYIHRRQNFSAIVSKSKDGQLLVNLLNKWKYNVVRGSSHVGGKEALDTLITLANENNPIAITPDGPTGPRHEMKAGAVITAQRTEIPLILCGVSYSSKVELKSWDKLEIPKLFSKVKVVYSDLIYINKNLNREETSKIIKECEIKLNNLIN